MTKESKEEFDLRKFVPKEEQRRTFAKVFDKSTIETVHKLATKGHFNILEHVISTGKEAHVFKATDQAGNNKAVKIYKTNTSDFNNLYKYLHGDIRFKNVRRTKRDIVFAWTKKEFKNLLLMDKVGIRCPMPIAFQKNVLVMEFIADAKGNAAPQIKELRPKDLEKAYETVVDFLARLLFKVELVYADFSEYNILNQDGELVLIDAGQAVLTTHPEAEAFFERDVRNMARYFSKQGLEKSSEQLRGDIREKKVEI